MSNKLLFLFSISFSIIKAECYELDYNTCLEWPTYCEWNEDMGQCQEIGGGGDGGGGGGAASRGGSSSTSTSHASSAPGSLASLKPMAWDWASPYQFRRSMVRVWLICTRRFLSS